MTQESNQALKKVAYYVGIFMVGFYILIGLSLLFTNVLIDVIPRYRPVIGIIILVYAGFRLYMALRIRKTKSLEDIN